MMTKQPFNEAGLAEVLAMLYSLDEVALRGEVSNLENDFSNWVNSHFELSPIQNYFLAQTNPQVTKFLVQQGAFAIGNRLPISLSKAGEATGEPTDGDKLFRPKSSLFATANSSGGFEAGGELVIEIVYLN